MRNNKGFVRLAVLIMILLGFVILGGGTYFVIRQNSMSQTSLQDAISSTTTVRTEPVASSSAPAIVTFEQVFLPSGSGPTALVADATDNLYTANYGTSGSGRGGGMTISKVTPKGLISIFAKVPTGPHLLTFDVSGNLYVASYDYYTAANTTTISKVTPQGVVSTFATIGASPEALIFDKAGNLYVAYVDESSLGTSTVSKITPSGTVSTFASIGDGSGRPGGPGILAFDTIGNLYTTNTNSHAIQKISPSGVVTTFATRTMVNGDFDFLLPQALIFDASGDLYVANATYQGQGEGGGGEGYPSVISKISPSGVVTDIATVGANVTALIFDTAGNLYTLNTGDNSVSKITPSRVVTTFSTKGEYPDSFVITKSGNFYVANMGDRFDGSIVNIDVSSSIQSGGSIITGGVSM